MNTENKSIKFISKTEWVNNRMLDINIELLLPWLTLTLIIPEITPSNFSRTFLKNYIGSKECILYHRIPLLIILVMLELEKEHRLSIEAVLSL